MAERDTCLVLSAATWFEVLGETGPPEIQAIEFRVRCRVVVEGSQVLLVVPYEFADESGRFARVVFGPEVREVPRFKILREESWDRTVDQPADWR